MVSDSIGGLKVGAQELNIYQIIQICLLFGHPIDYKMRRCIISRTIKLHPRYKPQQFHSKSQIAYQKKKKKV